jgi:hypothetical protein
VLPSGLGCRWWSQCAQPYATYLLLLEIHSAPCFAGYVVYPRVGESDVPCHPMRTTGTTKFSPQDYLNGFSINNEYGGNQDSYVLILCDLDSLIVWECCGFVKHFRLTWGHTYILRPCNSFLVGWLCVAEGTAACRSVTYVLEYVRCLTWWMRVSSRFVSVGTSGITYWEWRKGGIWVIGDAMRTSSLPIASYSNAPRLPLVRTLITDELLC